MIKFKRIVIVFSAFSFINLANAVPNVWTSDSNMGVTEFNLVNAKNQAISFSCSSDAENFEKTEPSFSYIGNWQTFTPILTSDIENTHELSMIIDGKSKVYPHPYHWSDFISKISKAKKIEVFSHNKSIATFQPNQKSIKDTAKYIGNECKYEAWR